MRYRFRSWLNVHFAKYQLAVPGRNPEIPVGFALRRIRVIVSDLLVKKGREKIGIGSGKKIRRRRPPGGFQAQADFVFFAGVPEMKIPVGLDMISQAGFQAPGKRQTAGFPGNVLGKGKLPVVFKSGILRIPLVFCKISSACAMEMNSASKKDNAAR
jgi:hypothetical protein